MANNAKLAYIHIHPVDASGAHTLLGADLENPKAVAMAGGELPHQGSLRAQDAGVHDHLLCADALQQHVRHSRQLHL